MTADQWVYRVMPVDVQSRKERQTFLRPNLKTYLDRILNVLDRLVLGFALTDTAGNGRAFDDPYTVFVAIKSDIKYHLDIITANGFRR